MKYLSFFKKTQKFILINFFLSHFLYVICNSQQSLIYFNDKSFLNLNKYKINERSKRNDIFVDLNSELVLKNKPIISSDNQIDYWLSIKRKWQNSELCPCKCMFDQFNRKVIKCDEQNANITNIPLYLDPDVEVFIFTGTNKIQKNVTIGRIFTKLTKLEEITITYSNLPFIGDATFWPAIEIKKLNLSFNKIEILNEKHFFNLTKLLILDLSHNNINGLPSSIFSFMPNLIKLNLSRNHLDFLSPRTFHNLKNLKYLDLSYNPIKNINQEDLKGLSNVSNFSLSNCLLKNLNPSVYHEIMNVQHLDLSGNQFEYIKSDEFRYLINLKYLSLKNNKISLLNAYSFSGHQLISLDLSVNKISELNDCSFCNSSLESLNLSNNHFKKFLPNQLSSLNNNLIELNLANNQKLNSKQVDNLIFKLQKIEKLNLANTGLDDTFSAEKSFQNFASKLKSLNLAKNNLFNLTAKIFPTYGKLEILNLSFNRIFRLSENTAKNLAKLIKENRNLSELYLNGNPFRCFTCHIWHLRDLLKLKPKGYLNLCNKNHDLCAKCSSPPELSGQRIDQVDEIKIKFCSDPSIFQRLYTSEPRVGLILALIIICSILIIIILIVFKYRQKSAVYYTNEDKLFTIQQVAKATTFSSSVTSQTESSPSVSRLNLSFGQDSGHLNENLNFYNSTNKLQPQETEYQTYINPILSRQSSADNYTKTLAKLNHRKLSSISSYLKQPISEHLIYSSMNCIDTTPIYSQKMNFSNHQPYTISVISTNIAGSNSKTESNNIDSDKNQETNLCPVFENSYKEILVDPSYYQSGRSASASAESEAYKKSNSLILVSRSNSLVSEETQPKLYMI